ncbi:DUF983 domain-containing protein [Algoriphagus confluentis]|uniref:DUF983 domain-containing protein n=1 Tax=Algoriphagus confluentis TaxID=1697556 RepID=A0ABQ6PM71_9BACT|nr:DUF983 domain-containing protein [Algoriphagus confluentis]
MRTNPTINPSLWKSLFGMRCPKCRKGRLFQSMNWGRPASFFEMKKTCENCHQAFEPEPGFYFGAMFISYALNTALFIAVWVAYSALVDEFSILELLLWIGISAILLLPVFFRLSRSIWITIFVPFQGKD